MKKEGYDNKDYISMFITRLSKPSEPKERSLCWHEDLLLRLCIYSYVSYQTPGRKYSLSAD